MPGRTKHLVPSDIRFTHDTISEDFSGYGETIENTFRELITGQISVDDIPPINVMKVEDVHWAVTGNRRLYLLQKLEECGRLDNDTILVNVIHNWNLFRKNKTTTNEGVSIKIRQDRLRAYGDQLNDRLDAIVSELNSDDEDDDEDDEYQYQNDSDDYENDYDDDYGYDYDYNYDYD